MQSKELLRSAIGTAYQITVPLLEDMRDAPLAAPTEGGNHALWIVGHMAHGAGAILWQTMRGEPNPLAEWDELFAGGTQPQADAGAYPPYDEVLAKFYEIHEQAFALLESLDEADLDQPARDVPEGFKPFFGTYRQCFTALAIHIANHRGQVAMCRRALKRQPLLA